MKFQLEILIILGVSLEIRAQTVVTNFMESAVLMMKLECK